jgi:capsule polysaccharide modification protein KpsS
LYTIDENYEGMTSNYLHGPAGVATYLNDDWLECAEVVLETTLNKGDMLFVPEACVLVSEALDETALDLTLVR